MPNHVTNKLTVEGTAEEVAAFVAAHCRDWCLDFNTVIPAPNGLSTDGNVETDGVVLLALRAVLGENSFNSHTLGGEISWSKGALDRLETALAERSPDWRKLACKKLQSIAASGHTSWYGWNNEHWGTKWNAYSGDVLVEERRVVLMFDTAWNVPEPVLYELARRYPTLQFSLVAFDSGWNFYARWDGESPVEHRDVSKNNPDAQVAHLEVYSVPMDDDDE